MDKDGASAIPPVFTPVFTPSPNGDFGVPDKEGEPTQGLFFAAKIDETDQLIDRDAKPFLLERLEDAFFVTDDSTRVTHKGNKLNYFLFLALLSALGVASQQKQTCAEFALERDFEFKFFSIGSLLGHIPNAITLA